MESASGDEEGLETGGTELSEEHIASTTGFVIHESHVTQNYSTQKCRVRTSQTCFLVYLHSYQCDSIFTFVLSSCRQHIVLFPTNVNILACNKVMKLDRVCIFKSVWSVLPHAICKMKQGSFDGSH